MQIFLSFLIALFALGAAYFWLRSTNCDVPAPTGYEPGNIWDGMFTSQNKNGLVIDLRASLLEQTKFNRYGALSACSAAALTFFKEAIVLMSP